MHRWPYLSSDWRDRRLARQCQRVLVFSRLPEPGTTKTRLIPALGAQGAASLQHQMTRHTLKQVRRFALAGGSDVEVRFAGGDASAMVTAFGPHWRYVSQGRGDLGERLARAFDDAFRAGMQRVICIGSDCPGLDAVMLGEAMSVLANHDVVIGPATDGGYTLIGMNRPYPHLFDQIDWGSPNVLQQTLQRCASMRLKVHQLRTLVDVDEPEDLSVWQAVQYPPADAPPRISVVIPTLNEQANIVDAIASVRASQQREPVEIIVVDGGSDDDTVALARSQGVRVMTSPSGRGRQLIVGVEAARCDTTGTLLFLHADSRLPIGYVMAMRRILAMPSTAAGAFRFSFDQSSASLRAITWLARQRSKQLDLPYGDQALFIKRQTYEALGGFNALSTMEDYEFILRLRRFGRVRITRRAVQTSARKYIEHGPWRVVWHHQRMIQQWHRQHGYSV